MIISKIPSNINNKFSNKNIAFTGLSIKQESKLFSPVKESIKPVIKVYDGFVERVAKGIGKLLNTDFAFDKIEKTKRNKLLMNHLMTFGSVILSGFYVIRTLGNKDLDEKKKKTLAINQAAVFALSTVMCYTLDGLLNKRVARFTNRFEAVNHTHLDKDVLEKCVKGMPGAKSVAIFDIIYRFIAPVLITPIANHIGNKMHDNKDKELAKKQQPLNKTV